MSRGLEPALEAILVGGLGLAATLLMAGLLGESTVLLRTGIVILMLTPVGRVVVLTAGLVRAGDLAFALVSAFVLAVLGSSVLLAFHP